MRFFKFTGSPIMFRQTKVSIAQIKTHVRIGTGWTTGLGDEQQCQGYDKIDSQFENGLLGHQALFLANAYNRLATSLTDFRRTQMV
jgi:hypothetical protein